jgi:hypothetical protein
MDNALSPPSLGRLAYLTRMTEGFNKRSLDGVLDTSNWWVCIFERKKQKRLARTRRANLQRVRTTDCSKINQLPSRSRLRRSAELSPLLAPPSRQSSNMPTLVPGLFVTDFRESAAIVPRSFIELSSGCCFRFFLTAISKSPFWLHVRVPQTPNTFH